MKILVLNSGSSSQKSRLYEFGASLPDAPPESRWEGKIEWQGDRARLETRNSEGANQKEEITIGERSEATERLLSALTSGKTRVLADNSEITVVGHRIVNGGREYTRPTMVTPAVKFFFNTYFNAACFVTVHALQVPLGYAEQQLSSTVA